MTKKVKLWFALTTLTALSIPASVFCASTISQGFASEENLPIGSIVSLKLDTTDQIEASTTNNTSRLLGVTINDSNSWLKLSSGQVGQIQVATSGATSVLVSDINGTIKEGDQITTSPIKGVGMKATGNTKVIGIAQGNAKTDKTQEYIDSNNKKQAVALDSIPILVNVAYYFKEPEKSIIPKSIQNIANAIAGKDVNTTPIIISGAIFIVTLIVVVSIIYSMTNFYY